MTCARELTVDGTETAASSRRLPRGRSDEVRTDILQFIAANQVDAVDALITSEAERQLVNTIMNERQNLHDRFYL